MSLSLLDSGPHGANLVSATGCSAVASPAGTAFKQAALVGTSDQILGPSGSAGYNSQVVGSAYSIEEIIELPSLFSGTFATNGEQWTLSYAEPFGFQASFDNGFYTLVGPVIASITNASFDSTYLEIDPGGLYAYGISATTVTICTISTGAVTYVSLPGSGSWPTGFQSFAMVPSGDYIYVFTSVGVAVVETSTASVSTTITSYGGASAICASPDGTTVYTAGVSSGIDYVWAIATATNSLTAFSVTLAHTPVSMICSPDSSTLYVLEKTGLSTYGVQIVDIVSQTVTATVAMPGGYSFGNNQNRALAISSDGSTLYVTGVPIVVVDTASATVVAAWTVPSWLNTGTDHPGPICLSSDGAVLYVADTLWGVHTSTGTGIAAFDTSSGAVLAAMGTDAAHVTDVVATSGYLYACTPEYLLQMSLYYAPPATGDPWAVELAWDGAVLRFFVNGQPWGSQPVTTVTTVSSSQLVLEGDGATHDEVRISAVARNTAAYTPDTAEFASDADTWALYHFDTPPAVPALRMAQRADAWGVRMTQNAGAANSGSSVRNQGAGNSYV